MVLQLYSYDNIFWKRVTDNVEKGVNLCVFLHFHVMPHLKTLSMFRHLYDERFNNLVIYSVGLGVPYDSAKDLVQECFIKLWENHDSVSNPVSWLFASVRNASMNWLKSEIRSAGRKVSLEDISHRCHDESSVEQALEYFHKVEEAYDRLKELTGRCKDVFTMVYVEKMKIREVAEELELSENTVKTYLKRAKDALRILCISVVAVCFSFWL